MIPYDTTTTTATATAAATATTTTITTLLTNVESWKPSCTDQASLVSQPIQLFVLTICY